MVKTLRITTIVAAMMAIAIFALPIKYGVRKDEKTEKFLSAPGVIETFNAASGNIKPTSSGQVHPLVQQAQFFAKILRPPDVVRPGPSGPSGRTKTTIPEPLKVTPKFTLKSTSFYPQNPEMSLALIDEPGKGSSWIRQGATINHLLVEQVQDGLIIVRNGEETFTLKTKEREFPKAVLSRVSRPTRGTASNGSGRITSTPVTKNSNAKTSDSEALREQRVQELFDKIKLLSAKTSDPDNPVPTQEERAAQIQKLITEFRDSNINISDDEAKKLTDLGELLESMRSSDSEN